MRRDDQDLFMKLQISDEVKFKHGKELLIGTIKAIHDESNKWPNFMISYDIDVNGIIYEYISDFNIDAQP